jgi:electron transfer flavoprotein beta subunit
MKILVCISNVPDTTTRIRLAGDGKSADLDQVQWVINPWDELALTRAVELKEQHPDLFESLTVVTVGSSLCEPTLRKALAVGADRAVRINSPAADAWQVAREIADLINAESFDLVLTGIESSDYNSGSVGAMVGAISGLTIASNVSSVEADREGFTVVQETDSGRETLRIKPPLLAVAQKGIAIAPRIPAMRGIMLARQKPLDIKEPDAAEPLQQIIAMELPPPKSACRMIAPDNIDELITLLQTESKVL